MSANGSVSTKSNVNVSANVKTAMSLNYFVSAEEYNAKGSC